MLLNSREDQLRRWRAGFGRRRHGHGTLTSRPKPGRDLWNSWSLQGVRNMRGLDQQDDT